MREDSGLPPGPGAYPLGEMSGKYGVGEMGLGEMWIQFQGQPINLDQARKIKTT